MSFGEDVAAFAKLAVARADEVGRAAVEETGRRLIDRSPVGSGHFRANWRLGIDQAPDGEIETGGTRESPAPPPAIPDIPPSDKGRRFFWVNNTSYAGDLEVGRGGLRPLGLMPLAEMEWPAVAAKAAQT